MVNQVLSSLFSSVCESSSACQAQISPCRECSSIPARVSLWIFWHRGMDPPRGSWTECQRSWESLGQTTSTGHVLMWISAHLIPLSYTQADCYFEQFYSDYSRLCAYLNHARGTNLRGKFSSNSLWMDQEIKFLLFVFTSSEISNKKTFSILTGYLNCLYSKQPLNVYL